MISVILCGGAGTRLWPLSREMHPKPFLRLPDGLSLLQKAFLRACMLPGTDDVWVVTRQELYFDVMDELEALELHTRRVAYILEPFGKNTAPAIAVAALEARRIYGDRQTLMVLPADQLIGGDEAFLAASDQASRLAEEGRLALFGIKPTYPEIGYGYIEVENGQIRRFVEKPDLETASAYIKAGNFYWNSGMFCFEAAAILSEIQTQIPGLLYSVEKCLKASKWATPNVLRLDAESFAAVPELSIDYAVMEKAADKLSLVVKDFKWSDLGSFGRLCALNGSDANGNRVQEAGLARLFQSRDCDVIASNRLIATLGLENILVVDTPDAVLIADKKRASDIDMICRALKDEGHASGRVSRFMRRPWGSFMVLDEGDRYKIKKLIIKPGGCLSLQMHRHRNEHWVVVGGRAEVTCDDRLFWLDTNESAYIRAGTKHRVYNHGPEPLLIIEVQSGHYLGEDDIIRYEDFYGRMEII